MDSKKKFIDDFEVTPASDHDSQPGKKLLTKKDKGQRLYGDSAYTGEEFEEAVKKCGMINKTHERPYKNKPLTKRQIQKNKTKSKTRARVEHVFASIKQRSQEKIIRTIGLERTTVKIGLRNLLYNVERFAYYQEAAAVKTA